MREQAAGRLNAISALAPDLAEQIGTILSDNAAGDARRVGEAPDLSTSDLVVSEARSGAPTARLKERWLHSRVDPVADARRTATAALKEDPDVIVLFGIGLGHIAHQIRTLDRTVPIVAVVPWAGCLAWCVTHYEPEFFSSLLPITFLRSRDDRYLIPLIQNLQAHRVSFLALPTVKNLFASQYEDLRRTIDRFKSRRTVNTNTIKRFGRLWVRNSLRNRFDVAAQEGLEAVRNRFEDVPSLVCAAGPTLEDQIPRIRQLRDRAVVIGVDTALYGLIHNGIIPDFAVVVDPQYWNSRHLDGIPTHQMILVTEPATYPRVLRMWQGPVLIGGSLFPLGQALKTEDRVRLGAGGSVATSAWDLARLLGSRTIYLAGLDLAFPHRRTHFRGAFFHRLAISRGDRIVPAETAAFQYMFGSGIEIVPTADRNQYVLSDPRMAVYRQWFSEQVRQYPDIRTKHLSSFSAAIEGIDLASEEEISLLPEARTHIEDRLSGLLGRSRTLDPSGLPGPSRALDPSEPPAPSLSTGTAPVVHPDIVHDLSVPGNKTNPAGQRETPDPAYQTETLDPAGRLADHLAQLKELATQGLAIVAEAENGTGPADRIPREPLQQLEQVDEALRFHPVRDVAGFLLTPVFEEVTQTRPQTLKQSLQQSRSLYEAILQSIEYHSNLMERYSPDRIELPKHSG